MTAFHSQGKTSCIINATMQYLKQVRTAAVIYRKASTSEGIKGLDDLTKDLKRWRGALDIWLWVALDAWVCVAVLTAVSVNQTTIAQHLVRWACRGIFVFVFSVQLKWQWWYFHLEQKLNKNSLLSSISSSLFFFFEPGGESRELSGWWDAFYLNAGQRWWPFNSACSLNIKSLAGSPCTSS